MPKKNQYLLDRFNEVCNYFDALEGYMAVDPDLNEFISSLKEFIAEFKRNENQTNS